MGLYQTVADIIDEIISNEGGARETDDPSDEGGRTIYGISERANPLAWANGPPSYANARAIYEQQYILTPHFDLIPFIPLRDQLIDWGVTSGPHTAVVALQHILQVDRDGELGPATIAALATRDAKEVNNLLVAQRELFYRQVAANTFTNRKFLKGWLARAHRFLLP